MGRFVSRTLLCAAVLYFCGATSALAGTSSCPTGTYDMLNWMTLNSNLAASYHLEGSANPVYTTMAPDRFYWTKSAVGYPWDIQRYDSSYIYLWITELDWNNPQSFKKFANDTNMPLVPRCAKAGFPGSTILIPDTSYQIYTDCTHYTTQNLLLGINQVWGPYTITLGGTLPNNLKVLVASYRYNCDVNYANCGDKEEYYLSEHYGLVQWAHYSLVNGAYQMQQKVVFNQLVAGTTTPYFPCQF